MDGRTAKAPPQGPPSKGLQACPSDRLQAHRLAGKTAIVTGGASGIGKAVCVQFAREGAKVVVLDKQLEPLEGGPDVMSLMRAARQAEGFLPEPAAPPPIPAEPAPPIPGDS